MRQQKSSTPVANPVGRPRTPTATQFKPGHSGNPKGRPKGAKGLNTLFDEELAQTIALVENGQHKKISKRQALVKQIVNRGLKGDTKAISFLLDYSWRREASKPLPQRHQLTVEEFRVYARELLDEI